MPRQRVFPSIDRGRKQDFVHPCNFRDREVTIRNFGTFKCSKRDVDRGSEIQMKRPSIEFGEEPTNKKQREAIVEDEISPRPAAELGEDLVYEVLKRADALTLGRAACVSRRWRGMAEDERLWEAVCTPHWANMGCSNQQLRSVVLALGGFRRLHSLYMVPLRPKTARAAPLVTSRQLQRWGKDEIQLSLSLLSIGFFERMNPAFQPEKGVAPAVVVERPDLAFYR